MPSTTLENHYAEHEGFVSDKWSLYLPEYERLFRSLRQAPVAFLEVGVQNGGSLEIWEKYFPNASSIVGCDINPDCEKIAHDSEKIRLVIGDIKQPRTLEKLFSIAAEFDIVIDDGSHTSSDIVATFCNLFPHLKHGGLYVVEDLHCSYWEAYEGGLHHPRSSMAFFKALVDVLNFEHWGIEHSRTEWLQPFGIAPALSEAVLAEIHSVEFVNSMCVLTRRPAANNRLGKRQVVGKMEQVCPIKQVDGTEIDVPPQHGNRFAQGRLPSTASRLTAIVRQGLSLSRQLENRIRHLFGRDCA